MKHVTTRNGRQSKRWFLFKVGGGGSVQKTTQNQSTSWDPTSQARAGAIWQSGEDAAKAGYGPQATEAQGTFSGYQKAGNQGVAALSGDTAAAAKFMDPYKQNVIDQNNLQWQKMNKQAVSQIGEQANAAGAFGGGRHGVAEGVALSNNAATQAGQNAQLLDQGYTQGMNQANQVANLGFGGAQQNAQVLSPEAYALQQRKNAFLGPQGQTSSGAQTTTGAQASGSVTF